MELSLTAPAGREFAVAILKVMLVVVWVGLLAFGLRQWSRRDWFVVIAPFLTVAASWVLDAIGDGPVGWYLN